MRITDMNWMQVEEFLRHDDRAVLPIGSTEFSSDVSRGVRHIPRWLSSGAEVIAGGSIHVYGALRGRAIAGLTGNSRARIFCRKFSEVEYRIGNVRKPNRDAMFGARRGPQKTGTQTSSTHHSCSWQS